MNAKQFFAAIYILAACAAVNAGSLLGLDKVPPPQGIAQEMDKRCQRPEADVADLVCRHWRGTLGPQNLKPLDQTGINTAQLLTLLEQQRIIQALGIEAK